MSNYVVTYNIDDASNRTDFVNDFETALQGIGLEKESSNQSTYFGYSDSTSLTTRFYCRLFTR